MELDLNEPRFPGFTAEASLEKSDARYGCSEQGDRPHGVSLAAWCWDPLLSPYYSLCNTGVRCTT
jgi:hypothetical protein